MFALERARIHRLVPRNLCWALLIRRMVTISWVARCRLIRRCLIRSVLCWSGRRRRLIRRRGWLIRRLLGIRWILGGIAFRVVVWRMCWVGIFRWGMWLRVKGLGMLRVGCLQRGIRGRGWLIR